MPIVPSYFNDIFRFSRTVVAYRRPARVVARLRHAPGLDRKRFKLGIAVEPIRMSTMAETKAPAARPLSPHLQVYRMTLTMVMSGLHRISGLGLYFGALLLAWWLMAAASGPAGYARFEWFAGSLSAQV